MTILIVRFAVRFKTVGFRGMQLDDLFAFLVMVMYTCDAVTVHLVCEFDPTTSFNIIPELTLSKDLLGSNVEASKFQLDRSTFEISAVERILKINTRCDRTDTRGDRSIHVGIQVATHSVVFIYRTSLVLEGHHAVFLQAYYHRPLASPACQGSELGLRWIVPCRRRYSKIMWCGMLLQ